MCIRISTWSKFKTVSLSSNFSQNISSLFKSSSLPYSISHFVRPDDTIIIFNSQTQSPLPAVLVRYSEGVSTRTLFQIRWPREPLRNLLPFHPAIAKTHVNSAETLRVWDELLYKLEIWIQVLREILEWFSMARGKIWLVVVARSWVCSPYELEQPYQYVTSFQGNQILSGNL